MKTLFILAVSFLFFCLAFTAAHLHYLAGFGPNDLTIWSIACLAFFVTAIVCPALALLHFVFED